MGVPVNFVVFPFIPMGSQSNQNVFNQDVIINEAYPGLVFEPLEPNSTAQVIREVNGEWWFVTNADWNATASQWQQNPPDNPALPAYAMALNNNGNWYRYYAVPTNAVSTPVTWVQLFEMTGTGLTSITPQQQTSNTGNAFMFSPNWAVTSAVPMGAFLINVTDVSSAPSSFLEAFNVNNSTVWEVRKDGTLVIGMVPFANVTGPFTSLFDNATFTGTTTFDGPVVMNDGLSVTGGETVDALNVTGTENVGGNLNVTGTESVGGLLTANGGISTTNITASGTGTFNSLLTANGGLSLGATGSIGYAGLTVSFIDGVTQSPGSVDGTPHTTVPVDLPIVDSSQQFEIRSIQSLVLPAGSTINFQFLVNGSPSGPPAVFTLTQTTNYGFLLSATLTGQPSSVMVNFTYTITSSGVSNVAWTSISSVYCLVGP